MSSTPQHPDLLAALVSADRRDPSLGAIHAGIAAAWCASLMFSRSAEGVLFGALVVAVVVRLPAMLPIWWAALRTWPAALLLAWLIIAVVAGLRGEPAGDLIAALPHRQFLVPLLVVPVVHRWRMLLAGLAIGATLCAVICAVEGLLLLADGARLDAVARPRGSFVVPIAAIAATAALIGGSSWRIKSVSMAVLLIAATAAATGSQRSILIGLLVGLLAIVTLGPWRWRRRLVVLSAAVVIAALTVTASFWMHGAAAKRWNLDWSDYSTSRVCLWQATLRSWSDRPWLGFGINRWPEVVLPLADTESERFPCLTWLRDREGLSYSHNLEIDVLFESGLIGLAVLTSATVVGLVAGWRRRGSEPLAAISISIFFATFAAGQFDHPLHRGISCGLSMLLATILLLPRPTQRSMGEFGLGAEDDWLDHWIER